jgi:hypothetical protein
VVEIPRDELMAIVLARAVADAINPDRPGNTAHLGNALFFPVMLRTIELLAEAGYRLERIPGDDTCPI